VTDELPPPEDASPESHATQPRKRSFLKRLALFVLVFLPMLAGLLAGAVFLCGKWRFEAAGPLNEPRIVWLQPGTALPAIATRLSEAGVITDKRIFRYSARFTGTASKLKAGEYEIPAHASQAEIIRILVAGKSIMHQLTLPEGLTSEQAVAIVKADPVLEGNAPPIPSEGTLLPETYNFTRGTTRTQIVERMNRDATRLINELWPKRAQMDLPIKTPQEALVLASIVEKETGVKSERPRVAAVFINRLNRGMRLQSDPTIIYGITLGKGPLGRDIRRSEIDRATPYNTYQVDGLPPTPICNPGRASIEAVLNPPKTDDLYFVADGTGGHAFARSLAEHNQNVVQWRRIQQSGGALRTGAPQ
jgi:UPF0755 protein